MTASTELAFHASTDLAPANVQARPRRRPPHLRRSPLLARHLAYSQNAAPLLGRRVANAPDTAHSCSTAFVTGGRLGHCKTS